MLNRIEPKKTKNGVYLSLTDDELFKKFFANERNLKYMCKLISYFTPYTYEHLLLNMKLYHHRFHGDLEDRFREGDFVGIMGKTFFSAEMNNTNKLLRNVEYSDKLFSAFAKKNSNRDEYGVVFQFNFDNFCFLDEEGKPIKKTVERYCVQNNDGELYICKFYINICLVNLIEKYYTCGKEGLEEWERAMIIMFDTDEKRVLNLVEGDEYFMEYLETVREFVKGYDLYESYDHKESERQAYIEAAAERAHLEGHAHGLAEGRSERNFEIAKSLFKKGMSKKDIMEVTGLTTKELEHLITN